MLPVSEAHLLCLMEGWFDATQPLVRALADYNYSTQYNRTVACSFCQQAYEEATSIRIMTGQLVFLHAPDCPVLQARRLREAMIIDTDDAVEDEEMP